MFTCPCGKSALPRDLVVCPCGEVRHCGKCWDRHLICCAEARKKDPIRANAVEQDKEAGKWP